MFNTFKRLFLRSITLKVNKNDLILSKLQQRNGEQIVSLTNLGAIGRCLNKKTVFLKFNLKILKNLITFTLPKANYKLTTLILHSLLFLQKQSSCTKEK